MRSSDYHIRILVLDVDGVIIGRPDGRRWDHALERDLGWRAECFEAVDGFNDLLAAHGLAP